MKILNHVLVLGIVLLTAFPANSQSVPSEEEVNNFFSNKKIQITYREGEAVYGTYYFLEIHYCPNGYGLYGNTVKQTVLGNEQRSNWQEFGTWKVMTQNGLVGIYYLTTAGVQNFVPIYKLPNGNLFISEGITLLQQGPATCY